ncbi:MAG: hypothetical protein HY738_20140 [Bacteroidia bacterium]|nr:hypothetical protein [Bacteroidia bacterium]
MIFPRLIKLPKPRQFNYIPRYYDERKERRATAVQGRFDETETIKPEADKNNFIKEMKHTPNIRGRIRSKFKKPDTIQRTSNTKLIVLIVALIILVFYLWGSASG